MVSFAPALNALTDRVTAYRFVRGLDRMNIRLRELQASREKMGEHTPLPAVEMVVPPAPASKSQEGKSMSITGLQSGAFQAMLSEMRKEIADAQNQGVTDVKAAKDEAVGEIKSAIANAKAKVKSEVADALQEFSAFTNGGPT